MSLSQIVGQRHMGRCCRARGDGAEGATHITISFNRWEMDQKMCSSNILGSGYIVAAP